jgi:hypothetical protein
MCDLDPFRTVMYVTAISVPQTSAALPRFDLASKSPATISPSPTSKERQGMTALTHPILSIHHVAGVLVTAALAVGLSVAATLAVVSTQSAATDGMSQLMAQFPGAYAYGGKTGLMAQQLDPGAFLTPAQEHAVITGSGGGATDPSKTPTSPVDHALTDTALCNSFANATPSSPAGFRLADQISTRGTCPYSPG